MRKKTIVILLVSTFILSLLAGCGAKTEATDQAPENSNVIEAETENVNEETEGNAEDTNTFAGAEDENIVLYAERGEQKYVGLSESVYYENVATFTSTEEMPLYDGDGFRVGHVKADCSIIAAESAEDITWSRFENPISGTEYDYLYILNDFMIDPTKLYLDAESMKQGIEEYIVKWFPVDVDATPAILDEKTPDMEMYECRMDSIYSDEMEYEYWFLEQFIRKEEFKTSDYETFYVECEEDTDGWIICRVYYKDPIDFGY